MHADAEAFFSILIFILIHFMMDDDGGTWGHGGKSYNYKYSNIKNNKTLRSFGLRAFGPSGLRGRWQEASTVTHSLVFLLFYDIFYF